MISNPKLSIVIPTYNRADFLDVCLGIYISIVMAYNVQIYVSDNASTDNTSVVVDRHKEEYPFLIYNCNDINLGADENFKRALHYPKTEYIWLLGDTYQLTDKALNYFFALIANGVTYDAILFNVEDEVVGVKRQDYIDQNKLLWDLGWHMTCMSGLVYHNDLISNANYERYANTCFLQTGIIFEGISDKSFIVHWSGDVSVKGLCIEGLVKEGWYKRTIEIWVEFWPNFVFSLPPSYKMATKLKSIKDLGIKSGILTFDALVRLRHLNYLNYQTFKQYSEVYTFTVKYSKFILLVICVWPRKTIRILKIVKNVVKLFATTVYKKVQV